MMTEDWRLPHTRYLEGVRFQRRAWTRWSPNWDHDHCAACNALFANSDASDVLHEGYTTTSAYKHGPGYEWVCPDCFAELKDALHWTEIPPESGPITRRGPSARHA